MGVSRREFLETTALTAASAKLFARGWRGSAGPERGADGKKPYGSGYFGEWVEDEFGRSITPAIRFTTRKQRRM